MKKDPLRDIVKDLLNPVTRDNIEMSSVEVGGVNRSDYPDFVDAYVSYAEFIDGTPLSESQLEKLNDAFPDIAQEYAYDASYHHNILV